METIIKRFEIRIGFDTRNIFAILAPDLERNGTDGTSNERASVMEVWILERTVKKSPVKIPPEIERQNDRLKADGICLGCGDKIPPKVKDKRGLHPKCYEAYRRAVSRGETTEKEMLRSGKILPASPGRPLSNPLAKELAEK